MPTILVIDDSDAVCTALDVLFSLQGYRVLAVSTPDDGLRVLAREHVDLVVQDMNFRKLETSGDEGVALFHSIRNAFPHLPIILLTASGCQRTAIELFHAGAADYLPKPWEDARLLLTVRNLVPII